MSHKRLENKRVLVTQAGDYMGPATIELFREHGAEVIADGSDLTQPGAAEALIRSSGHIDILVAQRVRCSCTPRSKNNQSMTLF